MNLEIIPSVYCHVHYDEDDVMMDGNEMKNYTTIMWYILT